MADIFGGSDPFASGSTTIPPAPQNDPYGAAGMNQQQTQQQQYQSFGPQQTVQPQQAQQMISVPNPGPTGEQIPTFGNQQQSFGPQGQSNSIYNHSLHGYGTGIQTPMNGQSITFGPGAQQNSNQMPTNPFGSQQQQFSMQPGVGGPQDLNQFQATQNQLHLQQFNNSQNQNQMQNQIQPTYQQQQPQFRDAQPITGSNQDINAGSNNDHINAGFDFGDPFGTGTSTGPDQMQTQQNSNQSQQQSTQGFGYNANSNGNNSGPFGISAPGFGVIGGTQRSAQAGAIEQLGGPRGTLSGNNLVTSLQNNTSYMPLSIDPDDIGGVGGPKDNQSHLSDNGIHSARDGKGGITTAGGEKALLVNNETEGGPGQSETARHGLFVQTGGGVTREFKQVDPAQSHKYGLPPFSYTTLNKDKKKYNVNQRAEFTDIAGAGGSGGIQGSGPGSDSVSGSGGPQGMIMNNIGTGFFSGSVVDELSGKKGPGSGGLKDRSGGLIDAASGGAAGGRSRSDQQLGGSYRKDLTDRDQDPVARRERESLVANALSSSNKAGESLLRAMTLDFEASCLKLERPIDREIFDLVVGAEHVQIGVDAIFIAFQGVLLALSAFCCYITITWFSDASKLISIVASLEPGFSRMTMAAAQIACVGSVLRMLKSWEHVRAFDVYENNFNHIRASLMLVQGGQESKCVINASIRKARKLSTIIMLIFQVSYSAICIIILTSVSLFQRYQNIRVLQENKPGTIKRWFYTLTVSACNLCTIIFSITTSQTDMRLKYSYKTSGTDSVTGNPACNCAECCWKSENDLSELADSTTFDTWKAQVLARAIFALCGFFFSLLESQQGFAYCTFPIVLPRGA